MSRRRFSNISLLIADLLDRHERSPGATRLLAPIDNDGFESVDQRDAFDDDDATQKLAMDAMNGCLESTGVAKDYGG